MNGDVRREWFEKAYYQILGVAKNATAAEIKKAYRKLAQQHHPDANPGNVEAEERFKEISAAHDVIGDEDIATVAPLVASETFDFAVVRGPGNAARAVQRALCDLGFPVDVDGIYGDETHAEVLRCVDGGYGPGLLQAVRRRQCEQFVRIVENDRSQIVFLLGWIRRALDLDA